MLYQLLIMLCLLKVYNPVVLTGPDFTDAGVRVENIGALNAFAINADGQTRFPKDISGVLPLLVLLINS